MQKCKVSIRMGNERGFYLLEHSVVTPSPEDLDAVWIFSCLAITSFTEYLSVKPFPSSIHGHTC